MSLPITRCLEPCHCLIHFARCVLRACVTLVGCRFRRYTCPVIRRWNRFVGEYVPPLRVDSSMLTLAAARILPAVAHDRVCARQPPTSVLVPCVFFGQGHRALPSNLWRGRQDVHQLSLRDDVLGRGCRLLRLRPRGARGSRLQQYVGERDSMTGGSKRRPCGWTSTRYSWPSFPFEHARVRKNFRMSSTSLCELSSGGLRSPSFQN